VSVLPSDPRARTGLGIAALLVAFALIVGIVDALRPAPSGPRSSSYATAPEGLAAYFDLLRRAGHPVRRLRTPIAERRPEPGETLVVLDPNAIEQDEARAIGAWVRDGGRLVTGGGAVGWLEHVLDAPPSWLPGSTLRRETVVPAPETAGVRTVSGARGGAWHGIGGALPLVGPADEPLLVIVEAGAGEAALLADPSVLQNRRLAHADNARLGVGLAGGAGRPVAFLETVHGYGVARGFGGLPANVKWMLLGLGLAALAAVWSAGRRLGPPEDPLDPPAPPRVEYVDALAAALARAKPDKEERS
jgi:hypothetical protein